MIGSMISKILDRICDLLYPTDMSGLSDEYWKVEDWDE